MKNPKNDKENENQNNKSGGSRSLSTKTDAPLTVSENKKKKERKDKDKYLLTQNEVENIYVLPPDDQQLIEETRELKNSYYLSVSSKFRIATWITVVLLAAWLAVMFFSYRDEITIENFRFLMRNVNFKIESDSSSADDEKCGIIYTRDDSRVFALYKDYFATVGSGRLIICDNSGNKAYNEKLDYSSPVLKSSSNYLLCFDRGGDDYSLYTYFNNIGEMTSDYPITDAAVCDAGYYAVATRDQSHYCVVNVYNDRLKLIQKISKNKYCVSVDINPDGSEVLVTSFSADDDGLSYAEIAVHPTDATEARFTLDFEGVIPYEARYFSDGSIILVCSDGARFISGEGKLVKFYSFDGGNIEKYDIGSGCLAVVCTDTVNKTASVIKTITSDGENSVSFVGTAVICRAFDDFSAAILSDKAVICGSGGESSEYSVAEAADILFKNGRFYICCPDRIISFADGNI